jgi:hypothetical protein
VPCPLLEGILKKECHRYINRDGTVSRNFDVRRAPAPREKQINYVDADSGAKGAKKCSSLRDLLWLLCDYVATPELKDDLYVIAEHIRSSFARPGQGGFGVLYDWRNSSAHGSELLKTVGGTVLSVALVVAIHSPTLVSQFENVRSLLVSLINRDLPSWRQGVPRPSWSFYPP